MYSVSNLPYLLLIYPFLTQEDTCHTNSINNKPTEKRLIWEHILTLTSICKKDQMKN
jgi:hypothetical protein